MGRYYSGDIEGKFWFGVQASDDADFFGVEGTPSYLNYCFDEDNLPEVIKGIKKCEKALGSYKAELDEFFKEGSGYTNYDLEKTLNVEKDKAKSLLEWYARLKLGVKIKECIVENGECSFGAEL